MMLHKQMMHALWVFMLALTASCSSWQDSSEKDSQAAYELSRISVLAVDNDLTIKSTDTFQWQENLTIEGLEGADEAALGAILMMDIETEIKAKGYGIELDNKQSAPLQLLAVAILDHEGQSLDKVMLKFGVDPGLGQSKMHYDKGSLVLAVKNPAGQLLWRGVVQIFTDDTLSSEQKEQRRQRAIVLLLKEMFSHAEKTEA